MCNQKWNLLWPENVIGGSFFLPPLSGDKGGAKTPARQLPPERPCVSPLTPPRLRRHRFRQYLPCGADKAFPFTPRGAPPSQNAIFDCYLSCISRLSLTVNKMASFHSCNFSCIILRKYYIHTNVLYGSPSLRTFRHTHHSIFFESRFIHWDCVCDVLDAQQFDG